MKKIKQILLFCIVLYIALFLTATVFDFLIYGWPLRDDFSLWEKDIIRLHESIGTSRFGTSGFGELIVKDVIEVGVSQKYIAGKTMTGNFYIDLDKTKEANELKKLKEESFNIRDDNYLTYHAKYLEARSGQFKIGISDEEFESLIQSHQIKLETPWKIDLFNIIRNFKYWFVSEIVIIAGIWVWLLRRSNKRLNCEKNSDFK